LNNTKKEGEKMAFQICTCGKPVVKSLLRHGLVAFYDNQGNEIRNCPKCGEELKASQK
jgi:ssDNA-binding Zn-finger/Zn-ribbon topoisomerase 1